MRRWSATGMRAVAVAAVLVAGSTLTACASSPAKTAVGRTVGWTGKTLEVGAVYSETGAGSAYGPQSILGAELAVGEINHLGGIRGSRLVLKVEDDHSDPTTSALVTTQLIDQDHVVALLGPTLSNAAAAAHSAANQGRTVMLATSNTGPGIVGDCAFPCTWIFRDSLGEQTAIPVNIADYASSAHPQTAAVIYASPGDTLGADQAQIAEQALPGNHISLVSAVAYPPDAPDLSTYVATAIAGHPDVLIVTGSSAPDLVAIMQDARAQGFLGAFLGGNTFNSLQVASNVGSAGLGAQSASAWYLGNSFPANTAFVSAYEAAYNKTPDEFAAQAYTGVELLAQAMDNVGPRLTSLPLAAERLAIRNALANVSIQTPLGPFSFTPTHDVQQPIWIVQMNGQGGYTLVDSQLAQAG